jgi:RNA recognition motif-containing protein
MDVVHPFTVCGECFASQIVEVEMPFDKTKNQRKGFCFITFESEQVVQELLKSPKQSINGKEVIHNLHYIRFVLMVC